MAQIDLSRGLAPGLGAGGFCRGAGAPSTFRHRRAPTGGTALTLQVAEEGAAPCRHVRLPATEERVVETRRWLAEHEVRTLNVAGPRASEEPGVYDAARTFLERLLER